MTHLDWHHKYDACEPRGAFRLLAAESCPAPGAAGFESRMREVGAALRKAGVGTIVLAHGTFVGREVLGLVGPLEDFFPSSGQKLGQAMKQLIDALAGDMGNYPPDYAKLFETAINAQGEEPIAVRLFHWSGQNHHLGRADGAVRLLDELTQPEVSTGRRVLLWGHSHAGNVFALLTHLLSGERQRLRRFFRAARAFYRLPSLSQRGAPHWRRVRGLLRRAMMQPLRQSLDIVTFGTPLRYSWNMQGCSRLLHVVHHVPEAGQPEYRAGFPPSAETILLGNRGDFVQQFGIAGTNIMPGWLAWKSCLADWRLGRLFQPGMRARDLFQRLAAGCRVADCGETLLVDYRQKPAPITQHLAGHAIYTRREWLLFHAEEVVRRLYPALTVASRADQSGEHLA